MPSLHENGWRQGSVFQADLAAVAYVDDGGQSVQQVLSFDRWIVVSQDCDLATADSVSNEAAIEIQPVFPGNPGSGWGIRARKLRLGAEIFTSAEAPKLKVSPAALSNFIGSAHEVIQDERATALKTWLGRRYDRPAVPEVLVDVAQAISKAVKACRTAELADQTHDILFTATETRPSTFDLIAVVTKAADRSAIEAWLAEAALKVDPALGTLGSAPEALMRNEVTLDVIENSWSADLSEISWARRPEPRGAH